MPLFVTKNKVADRTALLASSLLSFLPYRFDTDICDKAPNNPEMFIAETGWPTESDNASLAENGANSPADLAGLQTFLDTFVCSANSAGASEQYFFCECQIVWTSKFLETSR